MNRYLPVDSWEAHLNFLIRKILLKQLALDALVQIQIDLDAIRKVFINKQTQFIFQFINFLNDHIKPIMLAKSIIPR